MNYTLDTGPAITSLGWGWLILHYLLPVVLVGILLIAAFFFFYWIYKKFSTGFEGFNLNDRTTQVTLIIGMIVVVALVAVLGALK